ncbi:MAG TPA: hypothetical protein H9827_08995 [Candidatus Luteimonas excrementigallinarum]|nr:hypothetical protein [Candidatus Luteimonas excrementigallinarum]
MIRLLLVLAAIYLVARPQVHQFVHNNRADLARNREGLIKYAAGGVVLASVISILPGILINHYMRVNGFFAYEVFQADQAPFHVLSLNAWSVVILLSMWFFGFLPALALKSDRTTLLSILAFNLICLALAVYAALSFSGLVALAAITSIPLALALYTMFLIRTSVAEKAKQWPLPLLLAGFFLVFPVFLPGPSSKLTESLLAQMHVGGYPVLIKSTVLEDQDGGPTEKEYHLLLRTNEKIYVRPVDGSKKSAIVLSLQDYSVRRRDDG